ncbi:MAG: flagellar protein FlaG [Desulfuromonadales bacterium]|nr:flagellar protein FlaG [Desulfuromonadales bacterium]
MNVESLIHTQGAGQFQLSRGADQVTGARKQKADAAVSDSARQQIQPEELLQQINALTEDGLYSVRFEKDNAGGGMVVKVVDRETGEVIRQIPTDESLALSQRLHDLRGNLVQTEG